MIRYNLECFIGLRSNNQDNVGIVQDDRHNTLAIVCDGVGGNNAGDLASKTIVDSVVADFNSHLFADPTLEELKSWLLEATKKAVSNLITLSVSKENLLNMSTTIIACIATNKHVVFISSGDSRAYVMYGKKMIRVTRDHNIGTLGKGTLDRQFPAEVLVSALGNRDRILFDIHTIEVTKALHSIILMSDGVHGVLADNEIEKIINKSKLKTVCKKLVDESTNAGSKDNISVAFLEYF